MSARTACKCALWNAHPVSLDNRLGGGGFGNCSFENIRKCPTLSGRTRRVNCIAPNHGKVPSTLHRLPVAHQAQPPDGVAELMDVSAASLPHIVRAAVTPAVGAGEIGRSRGVYVFGSIRRI